MREPTASDRTASDDAAIAAPAPRRRRLVRVLAGALAALVAVTVGGVVVVQHGLPWWAVAGDHDHVHEGEDASVRYRVHVPPQAAAGEPLPVVVAIHGCGMTGYGANSMVATTQLTPLADREGFIVVYPTQRIGQSVANCWNSADPREQQRGSGDPALLAGVALEVVERHGGDRDRIHATGASSGAGLAVILGVTYPDVFASVSSIAGGEYGLQQVDPDDADAMPPSATALQAWAQMGPRARLVPTLVVQGTADDVVPTLVATRLVEQTLAIGDLVDDGLPNESLAVVETVERVPADGAAHAIEHASYAVDGEVVVESLLVDGMGHAWSGPDAEGLFTDRDGPDVSALVWEFLQRHPMP